jgi:lambda family phage portal protein
MAGLVSRVLSALRPAASPADGVAAQRDRLVSETLMHYEAATRGGTRWRAAAGSADSVAGTRDRLSLVARDMVRNGSIAENILRVVAGEIVGSGIRPTIGGMDPDGPLATRGRALIKRHLQTVSIDKDARLNLYGIQRLVSRTIASDGEVILRRVRRDRTAGRALEMPFQIQVVETDHLERRTRRAPGGGWIRDGIERDDQGDVVAYWILPDHPGSLLFGPMRGKAERVEASEILHVFRLDRPGQGRGVTWFAPIALRLQEMSDAIAANVTRQKIAALFAVFITTPSGDAADVLGADGDGGAGGSGGADADGDDISVEPGAVIGLRPGETPTFGQPPSVDGFDAFGAMVGRDISAGVGLTYEAVFGDLSGVNFSSGKLGRLSMHRNVDGWREDFIIPILCDGIGGWFLEAWALISPPRDRAAILAAYIDWTPPARPPIDPLKEVNAEIKEVAAGVRSLSDVIRGRGRDPEQVFSEIETDNARAKTGGFVLSTTTAAAVIAPPVN